VEKSKQCWTWLLFPLACPNWSTPPLSTSEMATEHARATPLLQTGNHNFMASPLFVEDPTLNSLSCLFLPRGTTPVLGSTAAVE
jgi:hypothetical protein